MATNYKTKYICLGWPEYQDYMGHKDFYDESGYDPVLDYYYIPEYIIEEVDKKNESNIS